MRDMDSLMRIEELIEDIHHLLLEQRQTKIGITGVKVNEVGRVRLNGVRGGYYFGR